MRRAETGSTVAEHTTSSPPGLTTDIGPARIDATASRLTRPALGVSFLIFATLVELGRQSGVPSWHSIWAEDGSVFLSDALNHPFTSTVFSQYAGYALVVPRVAAAVVALFPIAFAAWLIAVISSFIVACVALFVFDASRVAMRHRIPRAALAIAVVLLPVESFELTANLANIQWYLLFACFWALLSHDVRRGHLLARGTFALLAPLTSPLALAFAPIPFFSLARRRVKSNLIPPLAFALGLVPQAIVVLNAPSGASDATSTPFHPSALAPLFGTRVAGSLLIGDRFLDLAWRALGAVFTYGAIIALASVLVVVGRRLDVSRRRIGLVCIGEGVLFFVLTLSVRGTSLIWPPIGHLSPGASRYFMLPVLFFLTALAIGLDALLEDGGTSRSLDWLAVPALWFAAVVLVNYSLPNARSPGPDWKTSLAQARQACRTQGTTRVSVPVAPDPRWRVVVACSRL